MSSSLVTVSEAPAVRIHVEEELPEKAIDSHPDATKPSLAVGAVPSVTIELAPIDDNSTSFGVNTDQLEQLHVELKVDLVRSVGGVEAFASALRTDIVNGLSAEEVNAESASFLSRINTFGVNVHAKRPPKTYWEFCKEALSDPLLILLMVAGAVSVGLGSAVHPTSGWHEGVSILLAVLMVTLVGATNNFEQQKSFLEMETDTEKQVEPSTIVRSGELVQLHPDLVLVGDLVKLTAGRFIPADGLLVGRSHVMVNESRMTGESIDIKKDAEDPFLRSGTEVRNGECLMLVTAVGPRSAYGRILASLSEEPEPTPLQIKLEHVASIIGKFGTAFAVATLIVLIAFWGHDIRSKDKSVGSDELQDLLEIFLVCVTIVVVAVPEGLPLAVTLALAFSMKKMMKDNIMIRKLDACETMGNVSTICSDKTGTLTQNRMTVVSSWWLGSQYDLGALSRTDLSRSSTLTTIQTEAVLCNSQAWVAREDEDLSKPSEDWNWRDGNATEAALMSSLVKANVDFRGLRQTYNDYKCILKTFPFDSVQKRSSIIIDQVAVQTMVSAGARPATHPPADLSHRIVRQYFKGAAEIMVRNCSAVLESDGTIRDIDEAERAHLLESVLRLTRRGLRALAFTMVELDEYDKRRLDEMLRGKDTEDDESQINGPALSDPTGRRNILLGWVGIQDPLRPETYRAVRTCQRAGVIVRMVTGDALDTAKYIARECGILTSKNHIAMTGDQFRALMNEDRESEAEEIIPRLRVLARSLPQDKQKLVQWLKDHGEVVAATGDGTNDAPALNTANVGIAMNLAGTAVCKAAARIWILDDSLESIAKSILWGRSVYDSIRRFLQFQLTVNVVACILSFVGAVTNYPLPLTTVQLLWVNLIMDSLGALALATDPPEPSLLQRKPYQLRASILSPVMLRNIIAQSIVQLGILFFLLYSADSIFIGLELKSRKHFTLIFNTFVFLQLFNMVCSRKVNLEINIFEGMSKNNWFLGIWVICAGMQGLLVELFGPFASTTGQTWQMWLLAMGLGLVSIPVGILVRMIPGFDFTGGEVYTPLIAFENAKLDDHQYSEKRIDLSRLASRLPRSGSKSKLGVTTEDTQPIAHDHETLSDEVTLDDKGQMKLGGRVLHTGSLRRENRPNPNSAAQSYTPATPTNQAPSDNQNLPAPAIRASSSYRRA